VQSHFSELKTNKAKLLSDAIGKWHEAICMISVCEIKCGKSSLKWQRIFFLFFRLKKRKPRGLNDKSNLFSKCIFEKETKTVAS
jgi:hypothetical protein